MRWFRDRAAAAGRQEAVPSDASSGKRARPGLCSGAVLKQACTAQRTVGRDNDVGIRAHGEGLEQLVTHVKALATQLPAAHRQRG